MVSFTAFIAAVALCATVATAAPLPGKGAVTTTSCSTTAKPTQTHHVKHKAKKHKTTTSCSTTSTHKKAKPTPVYTAKEMKATTTSCTTTSKAKATTTMKEKKMTTTTSCTTTSSSTSSAMMTYSTPSYGSGMSYWNKGNGYNDCVQQCIIKNGGMKMGSYYKPKPTATATKTMDSSMSMGSKGTGATHTVIVAPSQGVLRYVPMAVNASVGDTIKFVWGANNHTVTKGSQLEICNKTKDALFTSGSHDKGFVFTQVVNDTKPTFFFCNTPGHCQKGMFGIINPANNFGSPSCAKNMMPEMMKNSSTLASMDAYMNMMDSKTSGALNWGNNLDFSDIPDWAQESFGENIMFTRSFLAANPDVLDDAGKVDLGQVGDAPFVVPKDLAAPVSFAATANTQQNLPVNVAQNNNPSASVSLVSASASASATFTPVSLVTATLSPTSVPRKSGGALTVRSQAGVVGVIATIAAFIII